MNHLNFTLPQNSITLLGAQLALNGSFHHKLQAEGGGFIPVDVIFEQGDNHAEVTVRVGDSVNSATFERHMHSRAKLVRFIEDAVNERLDNARLGPVPVINLQHHHPMLSRQQQLQLADLAERGGFADFQIDHLVIKVAVNPCPVPPLPHAIIACGQVVVSVVTSHNHSACTARLVSSINDLANAMLSQAAA